MAEQRKRIFDCDQHMYEERDSFTRYLPKEYLGQAVAPVTLPDGREVILAGTGSWSVWSRSSGRSTGPAR